MSIYTRAKNTACKLRMPESSRRGDLVEPVLSEAEGAARRKELDFLSIVSRLRWISFSAL
jgi:hypothetical protein